eukprot:GHUV01055444.1.p1 GENE.GHUV01055444.1~~GHUV01055444.1.p1  ORF type:complete len:115 (+),score=10.14 GHUV01055444.1:287-631(+)
MAAMLVGRNCDLADIQQLLTIQVSHLLLSLLQLQHLCINLPDSTLHFSHLNAELVQMFLLCDGIPVSSCYAGPPVNCKLCMESCFQVCMDYSSRPIESAASAGASQHAYLIMGL